MKKNFFLPFAFVAYLVFISCVPQENVYEGDLEILEPEDLRAVSTYTSITGDLRIDQEASYVVSVIPLENVNALKNLTHIGGSLIVQSCRWLQDLNGLRNLKTIGGSLSIHDAGQLANLYGLRNLTSVGGNISITGTALTSIAAFKKLTSLNGSLDLYANSELRSLYGLNNITTIGGDLAIVNYALGRLDSLIGLNSLISVGKKLIISSSSHDLTSLAGLENLSSVGEDIRVYNNFSLTSLAGLENITSVNGNLQIYENDELVELSLNQLNFVSNDFSIYSNYRLPISEVTALRDQVLAGNGIGGVITIARNFDDAYPGPVWFGNCRIRSRSELVDLSGYNYVTGDLEIYNGTDMVDLKELESLTRIGASLLISYTDTLTSLTGLENITTVGDSLTIRSNDALTSLNLDRLCSVGTNFSIHHNYNLCNHLALDIEKQVETCPDGGFLATNPIIDIGSNKDCPTP